MVVGNNGSRPLLLHNDGAASGEPKTHFVSFNLVGTRSNRDAMGARVTLRAGGITQTREVEGGGSFMSQSDPRAHFGLGSVNRAESVEIRWPSGLRQVFRNVAGDAFYRIAEGNYRLEREASERTRGTSGSR